MTESERSDPELVAIRARRVEEILARRTGGVAPVASRPVDLTSSSIAGFLAEHPRAVVDVWAPWCGPCRAMAPVLEALAEELAPDVHFGKLNADTEPGLAARWNVEGIPTLLLFERGRLVDRVVGAYPHEALKEHLQVVYQLGKQRIGSSEESDSL
jgi:thioredoxin 1